MIDLRREADEVAALARAAAGHDRVRVRTTSPVVAFDDPSIVLGSSTLTRTDDRVRIHLRASDVPAGAYTAWWVIFNPGATGPPIVGWGAGHVVGHGGNLNFAVHLNEGQFITGDPVFPSGSLQDARRAEIWVAVRNHGPVDPGRVYEQTHTFEPDRAFNFLITMHPAP